jgi:hypothetical protein
VPNDDEMSTEMFFNEKLNIAGAFSRHVVRSSYDMTHDFGSRGSTPSDTMFVHAGEAYGGGDAPSVYGGGDGTSSSSSSIFRGNSQWVGLDSPLITPEPSLMDGGAYWLQSPLQAREGRHYDEVNTYRHPPASHMEWSTSPVPVHMKVESPPHSASIYASHQQYIPGPMQVGLLALILETAH